MFSLVGKEGLASATGKGIRRIGLVHGRSGMPLFLVFQQGLRQPFHQEVASIEQARMLGVRSGEDFEPGSFLEAFFAAGGTRAHVLMVPFPESQIKGFGTNGGPGRRTGIHRILDWADKADLLVIPQASSMYDSEEYFGFCQTIFNLLSPELGMFFLMDLPKSVSVNDAPKFVERCYSPDSAVFHPWLLYEGRPVPPSVVISAWLQKGDSEVGVQELPADLTLAADFAPLRQLSASERRILLDGQVNTFLNHLENTRVWGAYTLGDKTDRKHRLIPLRRCSLKIRQATEQICEPFVLEAAGAELPVWVDTSLQNFFRSVRKIFHRDLPQPFSSLVKLVEEEGEERIHVAVTYYLPHSLERFSFGFVA